MAADKTTKRSYLDETSDVGENLGDFESLLRHIQQNPMVYVAIVAFILLAAVAGILFRVSTAHEQKALQTQFAKALMTEDPSLKAKELLALPKGTGELGAQIACMAGEAAFRAKEFDKAAEAFERVKSEFPNSSFVPEAIEGLGAIQENQQKYAEALAIYKEVLDKYPTSFIGRRQPTNIGRVQEQLGNLKDAVSAYQQQLSLFPGSKTAEQAQQDLDRLRAAHPELAPATAESTAAATPENSASPTGSAG